MSLEHSWQLNQEFRVASDFKGPFNFSDGANYLHYETDESFYVFYNVATAIALSQNDFSPPGTFTNLCNGAPILHTTALPKAHVSPLGCTYIDPNPIGHLNNQGHNYFLNQNPYTLNSYAGFGEANYEVLPTLKFTTGLRWTEDQQSTSSQIPS